MGNVKVRKWLGKIILYWILIDFDLLPNILGYTRVKQCKMFWSDTKETQTHNLLISKQTLNHLAKLPSSFTD